MQHLSMRITGLLFCLSILIACQTDKETPSDDNLIDIPRHQLVNPFIGTGGHGHTFPGATTPFGMVQLSPDTRLEGWDGCGGYHYTDSIIYGFSHTHLSGTGVSDYGDILLMPTYDDFVVNGYDEGTYETSYASTFSKENEKAYAGYYSVLLDRHQIQVELTATPRVGVHRYTFPEKGSNRKVILDLDHRDPVIEASLKIVGDNEIQGKRLSNAWAKQQETYFVARFSEPIAGVLVKMKKEQADTYTDINNPDQEISGKDIRAVLDFGLSPTDEPLVVRVGISGVSIEGARKNLEAEVDHFDFDKVEQDATRMWDKALSKISLTSENKDRQTIFYTALYHSMIAPNLFSDVDGSYRGMDFKTHRSKGRRHYTVFSLWDTFRATHPLFTIIERERTLEFVETFLAQFEQGGILPIWELNGNYTGCMIGYHSIPVITDAYVKGITDFDTEKALMAMKLSAEQDHLGLDAYKKQGFIGAGDEAESVSKTLEYAYDDWCIAMMAKELGKEEDYKNYVQRGQFYKNLYDPQTGFFRAKVNGGWFGPFRPEEVNFNYTEANAWQYSLFAPQDINTLINLMGGDEGFEQHLDNLFTTSSETSGRQQADITGLIGQYAHGNEPSHHMAYLYNYIGKPWKGQERIHQILTQLYTNAPDGLSGNEDCGQMSSWYVLSALGFYPVTPGSKDYVLGTPLMGGDIQLENGNTFSIKAEKTNEKDFYIQQVTLNGESYSKSYITHDDIMKGGELVFELGSTPNKSWGTEPSDRPKAVIREPKLIAVPFFEANTRTFIDDLEVKIGHLDKASSIFYTLDGTDPSEASTRYLGPFNIDKTTTIKACAIKDGNKSFITEATYTKIIGGRSIELKSKYANQYAAGGDKALIDFLKGGEDFRTGLWQGYQGQDFEAIVDLGKLQSVDKIAVGFLQDVNSWIFYPKWVSIELSEDGKDFSMLSKQENTFPSDRYGSFIQRFEAQSRSRKARFVRVKAANFGPVPEWHLGAGGKSWLFLDEIEIE